MSSQLDFPFTGQCAYAADMESQYAESTTEKVFFAGTHRTRNPVDTWQWIAPILPDVGITRVADLTGLDCIGIPVCNAIRPNARSLAVSQGKGVTLDHARVSAAMEAIELFHAERAFLPTQREAFSTLGAEHALDPSRLSLLQGVQTVDPDRVLTWIRGHDLVADRLISVPRDIVACDLRVDAPCDGVFLTSSNGLGSGNTYEEAALHALCEVIERDATCLHQAFAAHIGREPALIDVSTVDDPLCCWLIERLLAADIDIHIWPQFSDLALPSFGCAISDCRGGRMPGAPIGTFQGYGCHPDRNVALSRAITEAVQSRLTYISGARDDLFRDDYASIQTARNRRNWLTWLGQAGQMMDFKEIVTWATDDVAEDLERVLTILASNGFDRAIIVDLSIAGISIPVVKAIVPGMIEPTLDNEAPEGERVKGFVEKVMASSRPRERASVS
ncbi:YcaO-like family protein [Roseovarius faecimaris]|nr:YcaO-like family protein [Roseovarius faecimaris]